MCAGFIHKPTYPISKCRFIMAMPCTGSSAILGRAAWPTRHYCLDQTADRPGGGRRSPLTAGEDAPKARHWDGRLIQVWLDDYPHGSRSCKVMALAQIDSVSAKAWIRKDFLPWLALLTAGLRRRKTAHGPHTWVEYGAAGRRTALWCGCSMASPNLWFYPRSGRQKRPLPARRSTRCGGTRIPGLRCCNLVFPGSRHYCSEPSPALSA